VKLIRKFFKIIFVAAMLAAFSPSPLVACPACGSANSNLPPSPLTDGMNLGILTLFAVIATVLASIIRRENALARTAAAQNLSEVKA